MPQSFTIIFGKAIRQAARLRGGGSALPGLFVERVDPSFIPTTLNQLPRGVVVITGTNGKTTTTKIVTQLLEEQGLKVFTNRTGSNFTRGIAATLLAEIDMKGKLDADIAVLELDEAYAVKFADIIAPRYCLLLNVMRDQLDRFGEIDATARLLEKVAQATTHTAVINREDNRLLPIGQSLKQAEVHYYGLSDGMQSHFPNDDELHGAKKTKTNLPDATVTLETLNNDEATFAVHGKTLTTPLKVTGAYNIYNATGALALAKAILPEAKDEALIASLANVTPAFGRGETLTVGGHPLELVLVKNPSGFRLGLSSFPPENYATMIAINDDYADGRDMSWLWDVDFTSLPAVSHISGIRAYDMGLRLQYDEVPVSTIIADIPQAIQSFIEHNPNSPKRIYCTYTAMLAIRKELAKITEVEAVL